MAREHSIRRYRRWYARLLRLYPKPYRARFSEGMEQTFGDLCRECVEAKRGLSGFVLWAFVETFIGILRENVVMQNRYWTLLALFSAAAVSYSVGFIVGFWLFIAAGGVFELAFWYHLFKRKHRR